MATVALAHDYLTQRGGAERVVLSMLAAFPGAPLYTSLYDTGQTFPAFADHDVRTMALDRSRLLRRHHRWCLPALAPSFSRLRVDAEVVVCSSSGWAHGLRTTGYKIVYCHSPARWLYQRERYLRESTGPVKLASALLAPYLRRWDAAAANSADHYLTNSTVVQRSVREIYGVDSTVLPPPHSLEVEGACEEIEGLDPGFVLCVSRLLPYKNVDGVVDAFAHRPLADQRLVVVGAGPDRTRLNRLAGTNVQMLGVVSDAQLRWLYTNCAGLVAASYEDYGLTPLESAAFGTPTAALRWGGYLDTVEEGTTGVFFDQPRPGQVTTALVELLGRSWDSAAIVTHADGFREAHFIERLQALVTGLVPP